MTARQVRLRAAPQQLPLAFGQDDAIRSGQYVTRRGTRSHKATLTNDLKALGIGPKVVRVSGELAPEEGAEALTAWSREVVVPGSLDAASLARVVHQVARQRVESARARGGTPPEIYVTGIVVQPATPAAVRRSRRKLRGATATRVTIRGKTTTRYRRPSGQFISRAEYDRLRRQEKRRALAPKTKRKRKR